MLTFLVGLVSSTRWASLRRQMEAIAGIQILFTKRRGAITKLLRLNAVWATLSRMLRATFPGALAVGMPSIIKLSL